MEESHRENTYLGSWMGYNGFRIFTSSGKSVKNEGRISSSRKIMEFRNFIKNPKKTQKIMRKVDVSRISHYFGFIVLHVRVRFKMYM